MPIRYDFHNCEQIVEKSMCTRRRKDAYWMHFLITKNRALKIMCTHRGAIIFTFLRPLHVKTNMCNSDAVLFSPLETL